MISRIYFRLESKSVQINFDLPLMENRCDDKKYDDLIGNYVNDFLNKKGKVDEKRIYVFSLFLFQTIFQSGLLLS